MTALEVFREIEVPISGIVLEVVRKTKAEEEEKFTRAVLDPVPVLIIFISRNVLLIVKILNSEVDKKISVANNFRIFASYI